MQRMKYHIQNSRVWHLATLELLPNTSATLDNWTRYKGAFKEVYYMNDKIKFLEVDHFNRSFKFLSSSIRKSNQEDFRNFYKLYMLYDEMI